MTEEQVITLMNDLESDRVERTISFREDKLGPAVCAFANDLPGSGKPGYIILGVDDRTGTPSGITIGDEALQMIGNIRANGNVLPQPFLTVSPVFHFEAGDVVVVTVYPADFPPVRYRGRVYVRIGPRQGVASIQEERFLSEKRIHSASTFDKRSVADAKINALDVELFRFKYLPKAIDAETLAENGRSVKEQLASLGFFDPVRDGCTHAGLLMFGTNARFFIDGAYIQYVKFSGNELGAHQRVADREFSGPLIQMVEALESFVKFIIVQERTIPTAPQSFQEKTLYNYPFAALRELLMNALIHRDYESNAPIYVYEFADRIEIINPGGLFGSVRPENFPHVSDYRNPILATAFKNMGYINRFNYGVVSSQKALRENGNPEAVFDFSRMTVFRVSIPIHPDW
jgi:ATP-dependent DNA helicase RecG